MMASSADWRPLYPFASHEIRLGGYRCHYLDEGSGPAVLMVHGNPTWSFYWRELVRALRPQYRVVVPDHIGCGLSEKPSPAAYSYRLAQRVADLSELIEKLGLEQITLVAHDWGGAIGMGAAVAAPQKFARLVLLNSAAFRSQDCPWRIRMCRTPLVGQWAIQGLNLFVRAALRSAAYRQDRMTPAVRAGLAAPYNSWRNRTAIYRFVRDIPLTPGHPTYATLSAIEAGLSRLARHPMCLIWGMRDWCFTPSFLERYLDFFPRAEVHRLADAGHYVLEDAPEEVTAIVEEILSRHLAPPSVGV
jgi:haloalkane dehalogenase